MRKEKNLIKMERIYIRVTKDEKDKIKQKAKKRKKGISEVIRDMMDNTSYLADDVRDMQIAVAAEEICRYVEEKHKTADYELRKKVEKLWEICH